MAKSRGDGGKGERGRKGGGQGFYKTPYLMLAQMCPGCGCKGSRGRPCAQHLAATREKRKKREKGEEKKEGKEGKGKKKELGRLLTCG